MANPMFNLLVSPLLLVLIFGSTTSGSSASVVVYNVVSMGARPDGRTDSTKAFLDAWEAACASVRSAVIYVPRGQFLLRNAATFKGQCRNSDITFRIDGVLLSPPYFSDDHWISFQYVKGVSIYGGTLDAQGSALWACRTEGHNCPKGATSLFFSNSEDIVINGLESVNSKMFHIVIDGCKNVDVRGVLVKAPGDSPNTDGIHVQQSTGVTIMRSGIHTGDDCISVGPGTSNLWIEQVDCGPGHGISIGSLAKSYDEPGVQNVTVKGVAFRGTTNGLRIKAWGRPSKGFVRNVLFQHAYMSNVENPIVIDQNYCPHDHCPHEGSGVAISHVTYEDIRGTSATQVAVKFDCSPRNPCTGIRLMDVKLSYNGNHAALSSCSHADGTAYGFVIPASCF
ncbi:hypothetical protein Syun_005739 [Stephania yunnanensis]|uniref:Polygalacturonase n=1 Tax=Stephania yunnanensis TaxID=152371 RepID=A0AAP0PWX0_9MAGN